MYLLHGIIEINCYAKVYHYLQCINNGAINVNGDRLPTAILLGINFKKLATR